MTPTISPDWEKIAEDNRERCRAAMETFMATVASQLLRDVYGAMEKDPAVYDRLRGDLS